MSNGCTGSRADECAFMALYTIACLLLCIAIIPLVKGEWWEKYRPFAVIFWSLLFIIPFAVKYGAGTAAETVLECLVNDYLTFIVLLSVCSA